MRNYFIVSTSVVLLMLLPMCSSDNSSDTSDANVSNSDGDVRHPQTVQECDEILISDPDQALEQLQGVPCRKDLDCGIGNSGGPMCCGSSYWSHDVQCTCNSGGVFNCVDVRLAAEGCEAANCPEGVTENEIDDGGL